VVLQRGLLFIISGRRHIDANNIAMSVDDDTEAQHTQVLPRAFWNAILK
jgi:hypothetical protein